jgi:hypothetical protein
MNVKDAIDMVSSVGTVIGFFGAGVLYFISRKESKDKGLRAMEQIDTLATNHFPHMQSDLTAISQKTDETNKLLANVDKNIAILVDRRV